MWRLSEWGIIDRFLGFINFCVILFILCLVDKSVQLVNAKQNEKNRKKKTNRRRCVR